VYIKGNGFEGKRSSWLDEDVAKDLSVVFRAANLGGTVSGLEKAKETLLALTRGVFISSNNDGGK